MSSASELFYNRRSRTSRSQERGSDREAVLSSLDRHLTRRSSLRRRLLRRHFTVREDMDSPRSSFPTEHEPSQSNDNNLGELGATNNINNGSISGDRINRLFSASNGQLPTTVLEARARFLERIRGISVSRNRGIVVVDGQSSNFPFNPLVPTLPKVARRVKGKVGDGPLTQRSHSGFRTSSRITCSKVSMRVKGKLNDRRAGHEETTSGLTWTEEAGINSLDSGRARGISVTGTRRDSGSSSEDLLYDLAAVDGFVFQIRSQLASARDLIRRSRGLSPEAIDNLLHEVFTEAEHGGDGGRQCDCSVCLESFKEGDGLLHLHCGHRFHCACLEPWLRTCGDCPYCRARV